MTNEERHIAVLNRMLESMDVYDSIQPTTERKKAIKAAIKALEQQPCERFEWSIDGNVYKITKAKDGKEICQQICNDAISRDAVKKWICKTCPDDSECQRDCDVIKGIDALPPVTPQQKYGKWIEHPEIETSAPEYLMFYECSECGNKPCFCKSDIHKKRFCSNCGAKMQERR